MSGPATTGGDAACSQITLGNLIISIIISSSRPISTFDKFVLYLSNILSSCKVVESEGNMSRVTPGDDSNSGAVQSNIQLFNDVDDKLRDVMPAFRMHRSSRMQHKCNV